MAEYSNADKLRAHAAPESSPWIGQARWREANKHWLDHAFRIAIRILITLRERGMSQKDLAGLLGVSPQQVSKMVKGSENLTLETIGRIEQALGIRLIEVYHAAASSAAPASAAEGSALQWPYGQALSSLSVTGGGQPLPYQTAA